MRIFIISDLHFGKHSLDSDKWLKNMENYFYEFFIPLLLEYKKSDDKLFILGDVFDNRNSINVKVITSVVSLFEKLASIIETHILLGNHDMYCMTQTDINSIATIRNIENLKIYYEPEQITIDDHKVLVMPWISEKDKEKEILEKFEGCDLLFCHSDLNGCRTQLYPTRPLNKNILDIDDFKGYDKVYSGHIHIVQTINNFTFVGSPYHLDRNDIGNTKGIFIYDTKKRKDVFIENDYSPEYKKIKLNEESDLIKLTDELENKNNFIDLEISNNLLLNNNKVKLTLDKIVNKHKIEEIHYINDIVDENTKEKKIFDKTKSIKDMSIEFVDNLNISENTDMFDEIELRKLMKQTIEKCYTLLK